MIPLCAAPVHFFGVIGEIRCYRIAQNRKIERRRAAPEHLCLLDPDSTEEKLSDATNFHAAGTG